MDSCTAVNFKCMNFQFGKHENQLILKGAIHIQTEAMNALDGKGYYLRRDEKIVAITAAMPFACRIWRSAPNMNSWLLQAWGNRYRNFREEIWSGGRLRLLLFCFECRDVAYAPKTRKTIETQGAYLWCRHCGATRLDLSLSIWACPLPLARSTAAKCFNVWP